MHARGAAIIAPRIAGPSAGTKHQRLLNRSDGNGRIEHGKLKIDLSIFSGFGALTDKRSEGVLIKRIALCAFHKVKTLIPQICASGDLFFCKANVDGVGGFCFFIELQLLYRERCVHRRGIKLRSHFCNKAFYIIRHSSIRNGKGASVFRNICKLFLQRVQIAFSSERHSFRQNGIGIKYDVKMRLIIDVGVFSIRNAERNIAYKRLFRILESLCRLGNRHAGNIYTLHGNARMERAGGDDALP